MAPRSKKSNVIKKLKFTETMYRELFDSINICVAVFKVKNDGESFIFKDINTAAARIHKMSRPEVIGKTFPEVFPGVNEFGILPVMQSVWKTGVPEHFPDHLYKDSRIGRWFDTYVYKLPSEDIVIVYEDITERKKAEDRLLKAERNYKALADFIHDYEYWRSPEGKLIYVSPSFERITGYPVAQLWKKKNLEEQLVLPEDREIVDEHKRKVAAGLPDQCIFRIKRKDGEIRWIEHSCRPIEDDNGKLGTRGSNRDVTDRILAMKALEESEKKYRLLAENAEDVIWTLDADLRFTYVSPSVTRMRGYTPEETMRLSLSEMMTPESLEFILREVERFKEVLEMGDVNRRVLESELTCKDGTTVWTESAIRAIYDGAGNFAGFIGTSRDIAVRKAAEKARKESEEKYRSIFENAGEAICVVQDGMIKLHNKRLFESAHYSEDELSARPFLDFIYPDDREMAMQRYLARMRGEEIEPVFTFRVIDKDGDIYWLEQSATFIEWEGRPATLNFITNITEKLKAQQTLHESEIQYKLLAENIDDVIWTLDPQLQFTYISPSVRKLLGYEAEEITQKSAEQLLSPESFKLVIDTIADNWSLLEQHLNTSVRLEFLQHHKNGSMIWVEAIAHALYDEKGNHSGFIGVSRDISERKAAEKAQKESEEKYRSIFENAGEAIVIVQDGKFKLYNKRYFKSSDYQESDLLDHPFLEFIHPDDRQTAAKLYFARMRGEEVEPVSALRLIDKDGSIIWIEQRVTLINWEGRPATLNFITDITERKLAEERVKEMNRRQADILDFLPDATFAVDNKGKVIFWNRAIEKMTGIPSSEIIGKGNLAYAVPFYGEPRPILIDLCMEYSEKTRSKYAQVEQDGDSWSTEVFCPALYDGKGAWIYAKASPFYDRSGNIVGAIESMRDISAVKQSELQLESSERRYRALFENNPLFVYSLNLQGQITSVNATVLQKTGYTLEEALGKSMFEALVPEEIENVLSRFSNTIQGYPSTYETAILTKDGRRLDIRLTGTVIKEGDNVVEVFAVAEDITEEKQAKHTLQESEKRYRLLADNSEDVIWTIDPGLHFTYMSPSIYKMLGYTPEEAMQMPIEQLLTPEAFSDILRTLQSNRYVIEQHLDQGIRWENQHRRKDGSTLWIEAVVRSIYDEKGTYSGFIGVSRDVSQRKVADERIRRNEERLGSLLKIAQYQEKSAQDLLDFVVNEAVELTGSQIGAIFNYLEGVDMLILASWMRNDIMENAREEPSKIGYPLDKTGIWGESIRQRRPIIINDYQALDPAEKAAPTERSVVYRFLSVPLIMDNKLVAVVDVINKPYDYDEDDVRQLTLLMDSAWKILERRRMEEVLAESEVRYRSLLENAGEAILILQDGRFQLANRMTEELTGYSRDQIISMGIFELIYKEDMDEAMEDYGKKIIGANVPNIRQRRIVTRRGEVKWLLFTTVPTEWEGKQAHLCFLQDISESKKSQEALKVSEERFNAFFEHATNYCYIVSIDGTILDLNRSALAVLGYSSKEEVTGKSILTFVHAPTSWNKAVTLFDRWRETGRLDGEELTLIDKDGVEHDVMLSVGSVRDSSGKLVHAMAIHTDITEHKRLIKEQERLGKLQSVGTLAAGIAHDFNNILGAILGNVSLASAEISSSSVAHGLLQEAEKAVQRAKDLTKQLLAFTRGGSPVKKVSSIRDIIIDSANFATRGSGVTCLFSIADNLWLADIDEGQISQVVSNLVINARQAMPEGGSIEIKAENLTLGNEQKLGKSLPLAQGNYIRIMVKDYGTGIEENHIDRIFDPYFTTKVDGSGLGLAICLSIVQNHAGHISVESVPGSGTTFYVYLPACPESTGSSGVSVTEAISACRGRVLVLDDERPLREIIKQMLQRMGFKHVSTVETGREAVRLYAEACESNNPFDLVILDLTVPGGMGGIETMEKLREINPGIVAVISSGYAGDSLISNYKDLGFKAIIAKPYTYDELRRTLYPILMDEKRTGSSV